MAPDPRSWNGPFTWRSLCWGPPIGIPAALLLVQPDAFLSWRVLVGMVMLFPYAYVFGLVPAAAFVLVYRLCSRRLPSQWMAAAAPRAVLGGACGALVCLPFLFWGWESAGFMAAPAAFAGAVCAAAFDRAVVS